MNVGLQFTVNISEQTNLRLNWFHEINGGLTRYSCRVFFFKTPSQLRTLTSLPGRCTFLGLCWTLPTDFQTQEEIAPGL